MDMDSLGVEKTTHSLRNLNEHLLCARHLFWALNKLGLPALMELSSGERLLSE